MKCPSCAGVLEAPMERCPHCRLSLQRLDLKFGLVPAHSRFLTDRTGKLPLDDMTELRAALRLFQKKFPQTVFSILIAELPQGTSAAEYAFWLANRARFGPVETTLGENFSLLLVVDLAGETAALTVGYGLERHVAESDLQAVLDEMAAGIRAKGLAAGLRAAIDSLTQRLREISNRVRAASPEPAPA